MKLILQRLRAAISQPSHSLIWLSHLTWLLPFGAFCIGYICLQFFISESVLETPDLIGKDILQATKLCSQLKLNLRIIAEKEMSDAPAGTILSQNPSHQTLIKAHQSIFIVVSSTPQPILAPLVLHKSIEQIEALCTQLGIKHRAYYLPSDYPAGQCFAQMPAHNQPLAAKKISTYISLGHQHQYLCPDFTGLQLADVVPFLQDQGLQFDIFYKDQKITNSYKKTALISFQKPLPGTLVKPDNKLYIQLQVNQL